MKRKMTVFCLIALMAIAVSSNAQTLLAKWTFPTGNASDSLADGGIPANLTKWIHTEGGTSAIDFSKNGLTTKAAQATGWDNGAQTKCWVIEIATTGYDTIKISSKQQSGGNNPGPKDFILQYRLGTGGSWTDVPNTTIVTANNWTSGVLDNVPLPDTCRNKPSVFLRWLMTTNDNTAGGTVASTGIDKIDDIMLTGVQLQTGMDQHGEITCAVTPNPAHGVLKVNSPGGLSLVRICSSTGKMLGSMPVTGHEALLDVSSYRAGVYFLEIRNDSGMTTVKKVILY